MIYLSLFWEFFKTGLFAFGGGMATVPFLNRMAETKQWFTTGELLDMIAISESTPGPIGVNMATFAGFRTAGILGALCSTIGLVLPSVIIMITVAILYNKIKKSKTFNEIFSYIRPVSLGLIGYAIFTIARASIIDTLLTRQIVMFAALFTVALCIKKLHPVFIIAAGAVLGLLLL